MANLKISALTPAAALVGDEVLPLVQSAGNVSATLNQVLALGGDLVGPAPISGKDAKFVAGLLDKIQALLQDRQVPAPPDGPVA